MTPRTPPRRPPRRPAAERGVATLLVVMSLFFVVSLVAAYASRNLIFEQRTSANQYRSTQAFEAAEAGIEWALGLLNGGRIDAACTPTADAAFDSFRARYLTVDPATGTYTARRWNDAGLMRALTASCVRAGAGWACSCPSNGLPALAAPADTEIAPAFLITFKSATTPGQIRIESTGCSALSTACLNTARGTASDAAAKVSALVALAPAMPTSPAAPLTVRGNLDVGPGLRVANVDPTTNGVTLHVGGSVDQVNDAILESAPGGPTGAATVVTDPAFGAWTADRMFTSFFGVDRETFRRAPTTVSFDCGAGCGAALRDLVDRHRGRPVWITGDLTLDSDVAIGSTADPVLLVVKGRVTLAAAGARIVGIVYSQAADWASSGAGVVQGAVLAEGNVAGPSAMAIAYDAAVVNQVRTTVGPLIHVPGGWKDF